MRRVRYALLFCSAFVGLSIGPGSPFGGTPAFADGDLPNIRKLPDSLPASKIPEDGKMQPVRATSDNLGKAVTKPCTNCGGKGETTRRGTTTKRGAPVRPEHDKCTVCDGTGRVPNELDRVETASLAVVSAIVRMSPEAQGANIALNNAYDAITEHILKNRRNFLFMQKQAAANLAQVKPQIDKMVLCKGLFAGEIKHPTREGEKVYILRLSGKKQVVAIVGPKQADPPKRGGRTLLGGVIAGTIDVNTGGGEERVVVLERGFLIAPNLDYGWWNDE